MAISFSRPDPSSPAAVADANFPTSRRGFDQQQVRDFLRMVAAELARSQERERYLEQELRLRRQQPPAPTLPATLDDETAAKLLGEETTRILQAARESAATITAKADENSDRLLRDAREEARRVREDVELETARRRKDAESEAESELQAAKQQGREMVEEARAYRERALGELARRRDLARQQIDQLVHARDRLVQAFERARLAASDVVAELTPLGEFDEYVNLTPTTGPVPVMVPASQLADASAIGDDALAVKVGGDPDDPALDVTAESAPAEPADDEGTESADSDVSEPAATGESAVATQPEVEDGDSDTVGAAGTDTVGDEADGDEAADAEAADAEAADADAPADADAESAVGRDATVLQFPGNGEPAGDAPHGAADDVAASAESADDDRLAEIDDDDNVTASDVDALFARLRHARGDDDDASHHDEAGAVESESAPTVFERRDEEITPLIVASARKLKRVLADEQNNALEALRRDAAVTALDELVAGEADHIAAYFDAIADDVAAAARAGAASMPGGVELDDAAVASVHEIVREALGDELIRPLRDRLAERVDGGDGDNEAVTRKIRAVYRQVKIQHIDDHLDDFLRIAYSQGSLAAVAEGTPVRWIADPVVGPCAECEDNTLQGAVPAGSPFPTDHVAPPAHAGCRCLIAPVDTETSR